MLPDHLKRNQAELVRMRELVARGEDHPVLMINENAYTERAGYPHGELYRRYIAGLEELVNRVGGTILWRFPVLGQPVGECWPADEILGIWYPGHHAYLELPSKPGGEENYRLRALCVERARIHRCPAGDHLERSA
jgi:hypothetical protein